MNNMTVLLSAFWGIFLMSAVLIVSLIPSLKQKLISAFQGNTLRYIGSFFALIIGGVSIYLHNIWAMDMSGLITLFGWISLIKGITIALVPSVLNTSLKILLSRWFKAYLFFVFLFGCYLLLWSISF